MTEGGNLIPIRALRRIPSLYNQNAVLRTRRSALVLCVVIVLCVALVPAQFLSADAILLPVWSLFAFVPQASFVCGEDEPPPQPGPILSLLAPRAPPACRVLAHI